MNDYRDLPLFAAAERSAGAAPASIQAAIVPYPIARNVRLVQDLARTFVRLRDQHGRRSRSILLNRKFKPIGARLRRMGVPAETVSQELSRLESAVAGVVWRHDGCPSLKSGGESAA